MERRYATLYHGKLFLYVGKVGTVKRVDRFTMAFVEQPNMSQLDMTGDVSFTNVRVWYSVSAILDLTQCKKPAK